MQFVMASVFLKVIGWEALPLLFQHVVADERRAHSNCRHGDYHQLLIGIKAYNEAAVPVTDTSGIRPASCSSNPRKHAVPVVYMAVVRCFEPV